MGAVCASPASPTGLWEHPVPSTLAVTTNHLLTLPSVGAGRASEDSLCREGFAHLTPHRARPPHGRGLRGKTRSSTRLSCHSVLCVPGGGVCSILRIRKFLRRWEPQGPTERALPGRGPCSLRVTCCGSRGERQRGAGQERPAHISEFLSGAARGPEDFRLSLDSWRMHRTRTQDTAEVMIVTGASE